MEPIKITLCAACDHCPSVEIDDSGVRIGENHNTVSLTHAEWNDLVARVQRGELTPVELSPLESWIACQVERDPVHDNEFPPAPLRGVTALALSAHHLPEHQRDRSHKCVGSVADYRGNENSSKTPRYQESFV